MCYDVQMCAIMSTSLCESKRESLVCNWSFPSLIIIKNSVRKLAARRIFMSCRLPTNRWTVQFRITAHENIDRAFKSQGTQLYIMTKKWSWWIPYNAINRAEGESCLTHAHAKFRKRLQISSLNDKLWEIKGNKWLCEGCGNLYLTLKLFLQATKIFQGTVWQRLCISQPQKLVW